MENIFIFSILSIFFLIGLGILLWGLSQQEALMQCKKWTQTTAKITQLAFEDLSDVDGQSYVTKIMYEYKIRGKNYQNSGIAFGYNASSGEKYHRRIYNILATKSIINIYYDPRHPEKSIISKSQGKSIYVAQSVGIFFMIWGLGFMILFTLSLINFQFSNYIRLVIFLIMLITFAIVFSSNWRLVISTKMDQLTKDIKQC